MQEANWCLALLKLWTWRHLYGDKCKKCSLLGDFKRFVLLIMWPDLVSPAKLAAQL